MFIEITCNLFFTGEKCEFFVDTTEAGAGTLGISVDGPSKVALDCKEEKDGYKIIYTPMAPGVYYISVRYNGVHVSGSPYKATIIGIASNYIITAVKS